MNKTDYINRLMDKYINQLRNEYDIVWNGTNPMIVPKGEDNCNSVNTDVEEYTINVLKGL